MKKLILILLATSLLLATLLVFSCGKKEGEKKEDQVVTKTEEQKVDTVVVEKVDTVVEQVESKFEPKDETEADLWAKYNTAKAAADKAIAAKNYKLIKKALEEAAKCAHELNRFEIEAWQWNNMGYYAIEEFKEKTKYDFRMNHLQSMKAGPPREKYMKDTKVVFRNNFMLLNEAKGYLSKADMFNRADKNKELAKKITSNLGFIDRVKLFSQ